MSTLALFRILCAALVCSRVSLVCAASLRGTEVSGAASLDGASTASADGASSGSADAAHAAVADGFLHESDAQDGYLHESAAQDGFLHESADASSVDTQSALAGSADATADYDTEFDLGGQLGITPCANRPLLFVGVPSAPGNSAKREIARKTWMQYKVIVDMNCVEVKFFCGADDLVYGDESVLNDENEKYQDMVLLPVKDSYEGLTNKTLTIMQWAAGNSRAEWFMKLDDDSWPHLEALARHLQGLGDARYAYSGAFLWNHPVLHDGKWAEKESYQAKVYPPYAVGSGYMLSRKLVKRFVRDVYFNETNRHNLLRNEDSEIGVWIDRMEDKHHVQLKDINASMWGCNKGDFISMQLNPKDMDCMWRRKSGKYYFATPDDDICCDWKIHY
mmetsp:Transcript_101935/g.186729  ORF Transcript_101935/g.186729 Transcript_101935/m.186729 type:complete len:391 (-) Transcript_101935:82-1254(-)